MKEILIKIFPGIILSVFIAFMGIIFSSYLGIGILKFDKSPISPIMVAIVLGLVISNIFNISEKFKKGINFSISNILKFGIVCLGIRLGFSDIINLGLVALPIILICITAALMTVRFLKKRIKVSDRMSILIAVGTSVCGSSAIVATAPSINASKEEVTYAIANITLFGILAMFFYPFIAYYIFNGDEYLAGLFIGTSIHETAQVAGAALIYSDQYNALKTIDVATVTKLARNTFMLLIIPLMAFIYHKNSKDIQEIKDFSILKLFPIFILGFIIMGIFRTIGDITLESSGYSYGFLPSHIWVLIINNLKHIAEISLTIAMASLGLSTNLRSLSTLGVKPFYIGFAAAISVGVVSLISIKLIIV